MTFLLSIGVVVFTMNSLYILFIEENQPYNSVKAVLYAGASIILFNELLDELHRRSVNNAFKEIFKKIKIINVKNKDKAINSYLERHLIYLSKKQKAALFKSIPSKLHVTDNTIKLALMHVLKKYK